MHRRQFIQQSTASAAGLMLMPTLLNDDVILG